MSAAFEYERRYIDPDDIVCLQLGRRWSLFARETIYVREVIALTEAMRHGTSPIGYRDFWRGVRALDSLAGAGPHLTPWGPIEEFQELSNRQLPEAENERLANIDDIDDIHSQMYADGPQRATSSGLYDVVGVLFDFAEKNQFREIDGLLSRADVKRLAPEYLLGLLRTTFVERASIPAWGAFLDRAETEFVARGRTDIDELLQGLRERG